MPLGLAGIAAVDEGYQVRILVPVQTRAKVPVRILFPVGLLPIEMLRNSGRILMRRGQQVSRIHDRMS
jgi:hypothetical protein